MKAMLDDLKYIHHKDAQDALGVAEKQWQQYGHDFKFSYTPSQPIENVIIAGMGGSGLAASMLSSWPQLSVPLEVVKQYQLPAYGSANTLFIAVSYSGNTEETLSCFNEALARDMNVVAVSAAGELAAQAAAKAVPYLKLPSGYQPRMTFGYQLAALIQILESAGLIADRQAELAEAAEFVQQAASAWRPDVPTSDNYAKQLALELVGKSPVIYAGPKLFPAAYKWKISFNENAKNVAWCNQLPEFNHNEFLGWSSHPVDKPYGVIDLRSRFEHPRVLKRFAVSDRLLSGRRPAAQVVEAAGDNLLQHLLWSVALGDFVSLYLGLLNGLNPTPVDLIEKFKSALSQ